MEGLRYILREIQARRVLLHDFMNSMRAPRGFSLFAEGMPEFARDGELIYTANAESDPQEHLTVAAFRRSCEAQFRDLRRWSRLSILLEPGEPIPDRCEINEVLTYELGGGHCTAYILLQLWSPSLREPDRWFYLYVETRHTPGPRYPQRKKEDVNALLRLMGKDAPGSAEYADYMLVTPSVCRYARWKDGAKRARPRSNPAEAESRCGDSIWVHDGKAFTAPTIVIDKSTTRDQIWGQLLLLAWGADYLDAAGERKAHRELGRYYPRQVLNDILMHMRRHALLPYDARSNLAYMKELSSRFGAKEKRADRSSRKTSINTRDGLRTFRPPYLRNSVLWAHEETGIPLRTIYHLVRSGELEKVTVGDAGSVGPSDVITLTDGAIENLRRLAIRRDTRQAVYELAIRNGKSRAAAKKWLQRHRSLSDEEFQAEIRRWLGMSGA